jgi:hypothetical protein
MSTNIFGGGDDKGHAEVKEKVDTHSKAILNVVQNQKEIESNFDLLSEKIELLDHNSIKNFKKITEDIKHIRGDLRDLKQDIENMREFNIKVTKQMKLVAPKDEVMKLERYIDLWNPMDFVTREELTKRNNDMKEEFKEIVKSVLGKK